MQEKIIPFSLSEFLIIVGKIEIYEKANFEYEGGIYLNGTREKTRIYFCRYSSL